MYRIPPTFVEMLQFAFPAMFTGTAQEDLHAYVGASKAKSKKVRRALVQALRLCTGRTVHRGSRGIALPFLDHGTRRG